MHRYLMMTAAMVLGSAACVSGDEPARPLDKDFLIKAATCNHAEIEISKLADRRAASTEVKDFATMIVKEHQDVYKQLAGLLKTRKVGVVAGLEKETREDVQRLGKMEGTQFDREYLRTMISEHQKAIKLFEAQAKDGSEADIRDFAKNNLPGLREHLTKARELAKATKE